MSPEIQPADAKHRVRFLVLMISVAFVLALSILYLDAHLRELHALAQNAQPLAAEKAKRAVGIVFAILLAGALGLSAYLARMSWLAIRSERFPPPGTRVIGDTRIRRGRQARRQGQIGLVLAALTILSTVAVIYLTHNLIEQLLDSTLKPTPFQIEDKPVGG